MSLERYTLLVLGSVLFCACNNNDDAQGNYPSDGLVRISTTVSDLNSTRAGEGNPYSGTDLSLSIDYGTGNSSNSSNVKFISSNNVWRPASVVYWQSAESPAKVYAYAPYIDLIFYDRTKIPFTIAADQSQNDGLSKSDLVGFAKDGFVPTRDLENGGLDLKFKHTLSKLTLNLTFCNEVEPAEQTISSVTLNGTLLGVAYDATSATATINPAGHPMSITMHTVAVNASYEAILAPQTVLSGINMVTVTLAGGRESNYIVPASTSHVFASGYAYAMALTVGRDFIKFGGMTVKAWEAEYKVSPGNITDLLGLEYATIPATITPFQMGGPNTEFGADDERPVHDVKLSGFLMSKTEITNAQYCLFLNANCIRSNGIWPGAKENKNKVLIKDPKVVEPNRDWGVNWDGRKWVPARGYEKHPVINVTWYGAKAFANWVGGDLPTEAQWEYACRAGTKTPWASGDTDINLPDYACYGFAEEIGGTHAVGTKSANAWGLYDMHGNVWEWCNDWYEEGFYGTDQAKIDNPTGPVGGVNRVIRGGGWVNEAQDCRSAKRISGTSDAGSSGIGFRVVVYSLP